MAENLVFCENCRNDVSYTISPVSLTGTIKGIQYQYKGKEAHCINCNAPVYVPKINDDNLKALYEQYRIKNDIIPLEHIVAIPEKYAIGKRPLSLLLGWGEQTFSRYYDGDIPTRQYSDELTKIYSSPEYYSLLLEKGKGNLKSISTYKKSKKAVDALLRLTMDSSANNSKITYAIKYILNQCEDITPLALQKALYYIQGFYSAFYGNFLFSEDCEAWVHGPVYKDIYFKYRDYHFDPIAPCETFDSSLLNPQERAILDSVIKNLCCYSGKVLEEFTHNEAPWISARENIPSSSRSNCIITQQSIHDYFSTVKEKYNMVSPSDIRTYAQEMLHSHTKPPAWQSLL